MKYIEILTRDGVTVAINSKTIVSIIKIDDNTIDIYLVTGLIYQTKVVYESFINKPCFQLIYIED